VQGEIAKRAYELELLTGSDEQTKRIMADAARDAAEGLDGKRSRRLANRSTQALSWLRRKVRMPDGTVGTVRKAERGVCTVESTAGESTVWRKEQLVLISAENKPFNKVGKKSPATC
jgi:hypothetical protein